MSEESIHLSSQGIFRTPDPPVAGGSKGKPRFAEFACSHAEVVNQPGSFTTEALMWPGIGIPFRCFGHQGCHPKALLGSCRELSTGNEW